MIHVTIEEYDLAKRKPPFTFIKLGEFSFKKSLLDKLPSDTGMACVLKRQLQRLGYGFGYHKEYRFWSTGDKPDHVKVVVGNAEELAKLDFDAQYT